MPDYHCPNCGTFSTMIIGPEQAFCTRVSCDVVMFNPSLPDGGMTHRHVMDLNDPSFVCPACGERHVSKAEK